MNNGIQFSKFINEKVYLLWGEASLFIYFLIPLLVVKHRYIFYMFIISYIFSIYLRFTDNDFIGFLKKLRFYFSGGHKIKKSRKRY